MGVLLQSSFQPQHAFGDALVVQLDALHRIVARSGPVTCFEAQLGAAGDVGEACVVIGEGIADDMRQSLCGLHGSIQWFVRLPSTGKPHAGRSCLRAARLLTGLPVT